MAGAHLNVGAAIFTWTSICEEPCSPRGGQANSSPSDLRPQGSKRSPLIGKHIVAILATQKSMRPFNMQPKGYHCQIQKMPFYCQLSITKVTCCHFLFLPKDWLLTPNPNAQPFKKKKKKNSFSTTPGSIPPFPREHVLGLESLY